MSDLVIRSGIPTVDRCPVLTRVKAYIGTQGVKSVVEHQFTDRQGNPLDLGVILPGIGDSSSESEEEVGSVMVRLLGAGTTRINDYSNPLRELEATVTDAANGVVRVQLTAEAVEKAGLFTMSWAVLNAEGEPLLATRGLLSVEHSLWAMEPLTSQKTLGPPSLQEIRMHMMDCHRNENLLLDDVEFGDEQILEAVLSPISTWNESLPPLRHRMTTMNFPYRSQWKDAIVGRLLVTAAHNYRRNHLAYQAGGTSIDDKNKEQPYLQMGMAILESYKEFVLKTKTSINLSHVWGYFGSPY